MSAKITVHHLGADRFAIDIRGHLVMAMAPTNSDAAAVLEYACRTGKVGWTDD
jgi:hypothetical protein